MAAWGACLGGGEEGGGVGFNSFVLLIECVWQYSSIERARERVGKMIVREGEGFWLHLSFYIRFV